MEELLLKEETMWRQQSRALWLKEGDNNTKYFHRKASWRAKKNRILSIEDNNGKMVTDENQIGMITNGFFTSLFTKDPSVLPGLITDHLQRRVNNDMNICLCKDYSEEEISDALFQIGPLKAPGPDGFPARFFQINWSLLKEDVIKGVMQFFSSSTMPDGINDIVIVLIPKKSAKDLKDYRPISLCNVIYKVVSKCL